jgi:hypothetical protein
MDQRSRIPHLKQWLQLPLSSWGMLKPPPQAGQILGDVVAAFRRLS